MHSLAGRLPDRSSLNIIVFFFGNSCHFIFHAVGEQKGDPDTSGENVILSECSNGLLSASDDFLDF